MATVMDCQQARNLFDAYLDGELSSALATELHAHRLQCAYCRQELAVMEVAGHVIGSGGDEPTLEADFTNRLLACLKPQVGKPRLARTWIFRIGGVAAAAACLTLLIGYLSQPESRVAGRRVGLVDSGSVVAQPEPPEEVQSPSPGLDQAASALSRTLEDAVRETHKSSNSLVHLGRMTLLQMVEALQLEELRESDAPYESWPDDMPGEDAEDIEEL